MLSRKRLENDPDIQAALSSWGAKSISGLAAFVLERMYKAEASNDMHSFGELKKHIDYFSNKAGTDLPSIINGYNFNIEKEVFLDFSANCLAVSSGIQLESYFSSVSADIKRDIISIKESVGKIQTQLLINSWVNEVPSHNLRERILMIGSLLSPMTVPGMRKVRIGNQADGGYVMLDDFDEVDGALSLGINDDDSWDLDIANRGINVHQYDHTINGSPTANKRFDFFREKIVPKSDQDGTSISDAASRILGQKLLLKCDIEGSEWGVFATSEEHILKKFSQIVCEFHGFGSIENDESFKKIKDALVNLNSLFSAIHVHANNSSPWLVISGVPFPSVIEVTYANRLLYKFDETTEIFPTTLDYPNAPSLPEFYLGSFQYRKST